MTMHDEWTDKLSDYLDGELPSDERRAVAVHLARCTECTRTLAELEAVVRRAHAVSPLEPETDLWKGITSRLAPTSEVRPFTGGGRRFSFTLPQLAAASVLLALLSGWAAIRLLSTTAPPSVDVAFQPPAPGRPDAVQASNADDAEYDAAVADLESALLKGRGTLDPATIAVLEQNLSIIDKAVDEARQALSEDPANGYLSGYLVETRRRKLDLLRTAATLSQETN